MVIVLERAQLMIQKDTRKTMAGVVKESGERKQVSFPPMLEAKTQKIIGQIESQLGEQLITYWNSSKGSICGNDVNGLYGVLRNVGRVDRLSLFIKSDGGSGQASLRMVNLLR